MKYIKTYESYEIYESIARKRSIPLGYTLPEGSEKIDISGIKLIDPFELSYFNGQHEYLYIVKEKKEYTYDDTWSWSPLYTFERSWKYHCGYIIWKNDNPEYVVGIYEPIKLSPVKTNTASQMGGIFNILGKGSIITLCLDYNEYDYDIISSR